MSPSRRKLLRGALLVTPSFGLVGALHPARSWASLVLAMDLQELSARADRVVVADVTAVDAAWDTEHRRILSTVRVQVGEAWKGDIASGGHITIVQPGGVVGDIEMRVHGLPAFTPGESAVLFLSGRATSALVGLGQGKRPLVHDASAQRWMVERPDRSAAVLRDVRGRLHEAPPEPRQPLDEFRRQVHSLLGR